MVEELDELAEQAIRIGGRMIAEGMCKRLGLSKHATTKEVIEAYDALLPEDRHELNTELVPMSAFTWPTLINDLKERGD